jgi:carboxypeptidase family protein
MRRNVQVITNAAGRPAVGVAIAALAVSLLGALAPASPAAASAPVRSKPAVSALSLNRLRGVVRPAARPGFITGRLTDPAGASLAGACVGAVGPAGATVFARSRSDGRYLLQAPQPGTYRLHLLTCPDHLTAPAQLGSYWPGLSAQVRVAAGQVVRLGSAHVSAGQSPARSVPADQGRRDGSLSGHVTGHGHALRDICVYAFARDSWPNSPAPHTTTSRTGSYRLGRLAPGRYQVEFLTGQPSCPIRSDWLPQWYPYHTAEYAPVKTKWVRVRAGKDSGGINARLKYGAEIDGVVRAKDGQPVQGICVSLYSSFTINFGLGRTIRAVSDQAGHYALHALFPGSYGVQFTIGCGTKRDYAQQWWRDQASPAHSNSVKVTGTAAVTGINATLAPGAAISGTVRAKTSAAAPAAGICVSAADQQGYDVGFAKTGKDGRYQIAGLGGGRYRLQFDPTCDGFSSANYLPAQLSVTLATGRSRPATDVYLRPGAGIAGIIEGPAGQPVDSVCVTVNDKNRDYTFTDKEGRYSIVGVPPGSYTISFDTSCDTSGSLAPQWYRDKPDTNSADLMKFSSGRVRKIDVALRPGGTLTGVLTGSGGQPANHECIAISSAPDALGSNGFVSGDFTGRLGGYLVKNLPPGLYQISFDCADGRYADQWFRGRPDSTSADYLAINAGATTTLDEKLALAGTIEGKVTNQAGRPLANICVLAANSRNGLIFAQSNSQFTGGHGRYKIGQLTPGEYRVWFTDCGNNRFGTQWYRASTSQSHARLVQVQAGKVTSAVNTVLAPGGTISGNVTGPSGQPAGDVCVSAYNAAGQSFGSGVSGQNGNYEVYNLSTGRYSLYFSPCQATDRNLGSVSRARPVQVAAPGDVSGINISLRAGGAISGVVTGNSGTPGPQSQACVLAIPSAPDGSLGQTMTDQTGHYLMSDLAPGTYRVYLADPACEYYDNGTPVLAAQWYDNQPRQAGATLVTVSAGHTTPGVSASLRRYGRVIGAVTNQAGAGISGECVTAVPFHGSLDPYSELPPSPDVAITGPSGRYTLPILTPGRYRVQFTTGCGDTGFATQWWPHADSAASATVITIGYQRVTEVDATVTP